MAIAADRAKVRAIGSVTMVAGLAFGIAGVGTWVAVRSKLAAERITVSENARMMVGAPVVDPISAFVEADTISTNTLRATGGKTFAELPQDDDRRNTAMTGSFLRASLFTSVIAFGVGLFASAVGVMAILVGWGLRLSAAKPDN